ncbi:MAG: FkbM family methyltransferase [Vicinamibacterales bacterium]
MATPYWQPYSNRAAFLRRWLPDWRFQFDLLPGTRIEASLKKQVYLFRRSRRREETEMALAVAALADRTGVIYDLGANIGLYTVVFASNPNRRVLAFEPFDIPLGFLRRNLEINRLKNVDIHQIVLTDHQGTCRFTLDTVTLCTSHVSAEGEPGVEFPCSDLDSYRDRHGLPTPDVLKIDVEGADMPLLRGMRRLLEQHESYVFLEGGLRNEQGYIPAIQYLEELGYAIRDLSLTRTLASDTPEYTFVAVPRSRQ